MIPGLVGLPLELKLYWVGAGYEVVSGSAVTCMVHELNTRGSGGHRSYLVSGWIGLPPVLAQSGGWNVGLIQDPYSKPTSRCMKYAALSRLLGQLLPGHLIGPCVSKFAQDHGRQGFELSPRPFKIPQPRLRSTDVALETQMGVSPAMSLSEQNRSLTMARGSTYVQVYVSLTCRPFYQNQF